MSVRHTTFTLTLQPNATQTVMLRRHCGAARFAYNCGLGIVCAALAKQDAGKAPAEQKVPWTGS